MIGYPELKELQMWCKIIILQKTVDKTIKYIQKYVQYKKENQCRKMKLLFVQV